MVLATGHERPPELILEGWVSYLRDKARGSDSFRNLLEGLENRFGDIFECLNSMDFVSADTAYLLQPQKDGTYEPVRHNVRPGQLATALERGFLPLSLAVYEAAIADSEDRTGLGERGAQAESHEEPEVVAEEAPEPEATKPRKKRPHKCNTCGKSYTTKRWLNAHTRDKHGDSE